MNILFLTLAGFNSLQEKGIYTDLLREFTKHNHFIYVISPVEKRFNIKTYIVKEKNTTIIRLQTGNIQKTNTIEKSISTILLESQYKRAIKHFLSGISFDLVLYSTPPITFVSAIDYIKKRDGAKTYLLLKDIFPQNAVDIGMLDRRGLKGLIYKHFRKQEKKLYKVSDHIGCMSPANVEYVIKHNPEVDPKIVEVCPNSIEVIDKSVDDKTRVAIRNKYGIPLNRKIFVYGGNLGKPQGIPFLIECLKKCVDVEDTHFLIIGDGTEYHLLDHFVVNEHPTNVTLMNRLPKDDYDTLVSACDVGMIFLDHRFSIPNFPSRLLSYMQAKLPVLAVTDQNTDIGKVITEGDFGWWCESNNSDSFTNLIKSISINQQGMKAWEYLKNHYSVQESYSTLMRMW